MQPLNACVGLDNESLTGQKPGAIAGCAPRNVDRAGAAVWMPSIDRSYRGETGLKLDHCAQTIDDCTDSGAKPQLTQSTV